MVTQLAFEAIQFLEQLCEPGGVDREAVEEFVKGTQPKGGAQDDSHGPPSAARMNLAAPGNTRAHMASLAGDAISAIEDALERSSMGPLRSFLDHGYYERQG